MLTAQENILLTRVGPGTPGGELLRRYWWPVAMLPELSDETPTKHVRILGEDLVIFRDKSGRVGLLADHCAHRGASLLYGRVEERGISCAYHGWLYDTEGNCLETPAEPSGSLLHLTVKQRAYPFQVRYGLYWAYLGPQPAPVLPRIDVAEMGSLSIKLTERYDCNWLQIVENNLDQSHVFILHQSSSRRGQAGMNTTRGRIDELVSIEYQEEPFGIRRRQVHTTGYDDTDLMIFPASQRNMNFFHVKVPIDDTQTRRYSIFTRLDLDGFAERHETYSVDGNIEYSSELFAGDKTPIDSVHPFARYSMDGVQPEDHTILETQGRIAPRESEHLATSDRGLALLRTMLLREIEKVQQGLDPIGVIRDPSQDMIATHIESYMQTVSRHPARQANIGSRR